MSTPLARIPHSPTITILIRPWTLADIPTAAAHANNAKIAAYMTERYPSPYTESDADWWVRRHQDPANWGSVPNESTGEGTTTVPLAYAIVMVHHGETEKEEAMGGIGLVLGTDVRRRSAEVGYWVAERYWGQGIMGRVLPAFVQWVWRAFPGLLRLVAEVFEGNAASEHVLQKAGFRWEGRMRGAVWKLGKVQDLVVFGLLRDDGAV